MDKFFSDPPFVLFYDTNPRRLTVHSKYISHLTWSRSTNAPIPFYKQVSRTCKCQEHLVFTGEKPTICPRQFLKINQIVVGFIAIFKLNPFI